MQQTQAGAQQQAATGLPGSFYAAPHNVSCMPAQMPGATPAACSGPPGAVPASMTGLPAGGIMSTGAAGLLPMSAPCFAGGPQGSMQAGAAGPHAMRPSRISLQPRSPAFQQHSAPGALLVRSSGVYTSRDVNSCFLRTHLLVQSVGPDTYCSYHGHRTCCHNLLSCCRRQPRVQPASAAAPALASWAASARAAVAARRAGRTASQGPRAPRCVAAAEAWPA